MQRTRTQKPRYYLVYAIAPQDLGAAEANRVFNDFVADPNLPLVLFHDHFIGEAGGLAIFYIGDSQQLDALLDSQHLAGWEVDMQPLIFSRSPSAFDEQIAFTLSAYRGQDWEALQKQERPTYGDPRVEAETAHEDAS